MKELDGRVLESSDSSVLLLKLDSGYNIGIPKENILAGGLRNINLRRSLWERESSSELRKV